MKLAILGATGKTGIEAVKQALDLGHHVNALVRTPSKLTITHPNLTVIQGDAMNSADVQKTLQGVDAVINALGHVKGSPDNLQTVVIEHVINAMKANNVKRLVTLSGGGVRFPGDKPKFIDHVFKFLLSVMSPKVLADGERHIEILKKSNVEWVVVRGPRLTDNAHTGRYKVGMIGDEGMSTQCSRANVADFMLKCVSDNKWVGKGPFISE
jgi:putative NADH-flavin reductase